MSSSLPRQWRNGALVCLAGLAAAMSSRPLRAAGIDGADTACTQLLAAAALEFRTKRADELYCQMPPHIQSGYYFFRLRGRYPAPPHADADWAGSNLMGDFAVRRRDGAVFYCDDAGQPTGRRLGLKRTR